MTYDTKAIRAMYPNPIPARILHLHEHGYCVGGAVQCVVRQKEIPWGGAFPSPFTLAAVLRTANPALSKEEAREIAGKIARANDSDRYEEAWAHAEDALTRHQEGVAEAEGEVAEVD